MNQEYLEGAQCEGMFRFKLLLHSDWPKLMRDEFLFPKSSVDWFVWAQSNTTRVNENTIIYFRRMGIELCERENSYHAA